LTYLDRRRDVKETGHNAGGKGNSDDDDDGSLTREKQRAAQYLPNYKAPDGEFSSFPDLTPTTIKRLNDSGIKNFFPIQ